jgi:succinoglycan biosynthesis protein ExoM
MLPHLTICICTYQRPDLLRRLLDGIANQETDNLFTVSVVVSDNDAAESARSAVEGFIATSTLPVTYGAEPRKNIAHARNHALKLATGDFIVFIDDDEFPAPRWLLNLWKTCEKFDAAGVLGPVRPHFEQPPPEWIIRGKFCERPEHETGRVMPWDECRTGNVLFRRSIIGSNPEPFDPAFGTGGEDKDFFMRMSQAGAVFVWCNEAVAYETVPPPRWRRSYMLRRALLRGQNILKHPGVKAELLTKSFAAVPLYAVILPFTALLGQHRFMDYAIRFCDHLGRLLALVGLNWVRERQM